MKTLQNFLHLNFKNVVALLILIFAFAANSLAQPQYYNTNTGTGINTFPFGQPAGMRVQWLIRAGEFNQPTGAPSGSITTIYFFMGSTMTTTFTNLTIRLGQATITTLPSGVFYTGQLDTVYHRTSVVLSSINNGWMMLTLGRPFPYDPAQSLIIDVLQCGASNTGMHVRQSTTTPNTRSWSTIAGCTAPYSGSDGQWINCGVDVAPLPPVLVSPPNNAIGIPTSLTFVWNKAPGTIINYWWRLTTDTVSLARKSVV